MKRVLVILALATTAAAPVADPDWPCQQRLVITLTAATLWAGPTPQQDWHANAPIAALVPQIADRRISVQDGIAKLQQFVATKPGDEARAELFAGLVEQSNIDRTAAIERLRQVSRNIRALADAVTTATHQLEQLPADAPTDQRDEIVNRRALLLQQYDDLSRTVRYACEIPVDFEHRLGQFARVLQPAAD